MMIGPRLVAPMNEMLQFGDFLPREVASILKVLQKLSCKSREDIPILNYCPFSYPHLVCFVGLLFLAPSSNGVVRLY